MQLRIITGRAGAGKSHLLMKEMTAASAAKPVGAPLIFLVPEQASFNAEWTLLNKFDISGSLRIKVCGFHKLFSLLADEQGIQTEPWINDLGKSMILRRLVGGHRHDFTVFGKVARHSGFVDNLRLIMDELATYGVEPQALQSVGSYFAGSGDNRIIAEKLNDISLIYEEYLASLAENYCDETKLLQTLAASVETSSLLAEAEVYVDGFTDFDPAQAEVLKALVKKCRAVNVALIADKERTCEEDSIFAFTEKTFAWLEDFAAAEQIHFEHIHLAENYRHRDNPALSQVEQAFARKIFRPVQAGKNEKEKEPLPIKIVQAKTTREQLEFIAESILRQVRDESCRMADFAVVSRDLAECRTLICDVFDKYDIPYFADVAKNMYHHPLVETVLALLEVESESWQSAAVLRFLKTGLLPVDYEELCRLENYALANGIRGSQWQKAGSWERYYDGSRDLLKSENEEVRQEAVEKLAAINEIGSRCVAPLLQFHRQLKDLPKTEGKYLLADMVGALLDFMDDVQVTDILAEWEQAAQADGDGESASFHGQIFRAVQDLLQQLAAFLGDIQVRPGELADLIAEGGSKLELHSIPPAVDEVMISDIGRSRLADVKCAFVIDCNEGMFPMRVAEDGLLNSQEREELKKVGLRLAVNQRELQFAEDYLVYIALTRASEKLYLCYSDFDMSGGAMQPSVIINNLLGVLPDVQLVSAKAAETPSEENIFNNRALAEAVEQHIATAREGGEIPEIWWRLLKYYSENQLYTAEIKALTAGMNYCKHNENLPAEIVEALYGNADTTSVSRVEVYNQCPCKYYGRYGLRLEERDKFEIDSRAVGNIYHDILAQVLKQLTDDEADFAALTIENIRPLITVAMDEYAQSGMGKLLEDNGKNRYLRDKIQAVVGGALLDIACHMAAGNFRPVAFEVAFGKRGGEIAGMTLRLPSGKEVTVHGFIDRIDKACGADSEYYRIIDYKSSDKNLNLRDIYYGKNWQMPIYLQALLESIGGETGRNAKPAGMFYFPVQDWVAAVNSGKDGNLTRIKKLQGIIILDDEAVQLAEQNLSTNRSAVTMNLSLNKDKDGDPSLQYRKGESGIRPDDYQVMQNYIRRNLTANVHKILQGDIRQLPLSKNNQPDCEYCDYEKICLLDNIIRPEVRKMDSSMKTESALLHMKKDLQDSENAGSEIEN